MSIDLYGADVTNMMEKEAIRDLIDEFKSGLIAKVQLGILLRKNIKDADKL